MPQSVWSGCVSLSPVFDHNATNALCKSNLWICCCDNFWLVLREGDQRTDSEVYRDVNAVYAWFELQYFARARSQLYKSFYTALCLASCRLRRRRLLVSSVDRFVYMVEYDMEKGIVCVKASMPIYLDRHPLHDYEPVSRTAHTWIGMHRQRACRQFAVVQEVRQSVLPSFRKLVDMAHPNVIRPLALYIAAETFVAYEHEHVELDIFDTIPLSIKEVASAMSHVWSVANQSVYRSR